MYCCVMLLHFVLLLNFYFVFGLCVVELCFVVKIFVLLLNFSAFLSAQKDLLSQAEERLELFRDKLDKVNSIREDLKSHIQSLPG